MPILKRKLITFHKFTSCARNMHRFMDFNARRGHYTHLVLPPAVKFHLVIPALRLRKTEKGN